MASYYRPGALPGGRMLLGHCWTSFAHLAASPAGRQTTMASFGELLLAGVPARWLACGHDRLLLTTTSRIPCMSGYMLLAGCWIRFGCSRALCLARRDALDGLPSWLCWRMSCLSPMTAWRTPANVWPTPYARVPSFMWETFCLL
jgi:hypothetical protein